MIELNLSDTIVLPGQDITISLTCAAAGPRPKYLYLHHHIYEGKGAVPDRQPVAVQWAGTEGKAALQLPEPGNYALTATRDDLRVCRRPVGDLDPEPAKTPYRNLACVGPESTVIRHMVADSSQPFSGLIHGYRASVDYFMVPLDPPRYDYCSFARMFGDTISPAVHPNSLQAFFPELALSDANWRAYPDDIVRRLVMFVQERWQQLGYRPLTILGTYTTSTGLVRMCKEVGINTLTNQSTDHYFRDGGWDIANPGMPDIPYFMAETDFRCPEPPSAGGVFGAPQGQFLAPISYRFWTDYLLDSACFQREDRSFEHGVVPWRALDLLDAFVNSSRAVGGPDVINVGIEGGETMWARSILRINRALIRRSLTLAQHGRGRIVLGTSDGMRQFALRNGGPAWPPARLAVVPDIYAGRDFSRKPIIAATAAMTDHPEFHADFTAESPFPLALWPRKGARGRQSFPGNSPTVPFSDVPQGWPTGCVPRPLGMSDARIRWCEVRGGAEVTVTFRSREAWDAAPVLLWQPPILPSQLDGTQHGVQWISARPQQGRVGAILLVGPIHRPGSTTWKVVIPGRPAAARRSDVVKITTPAQGGLTLVAMPPSLESARHAYLVKTRPGRAAVNITAGVTRAETHEGESGPPTSSFILTNESPYLRVWLKRGAKVRAKARFVPQRIPPGFSLEKDTEQLHDWVRREVLRPTERLVFSLGCFRKCVAGTWGHPDQEDHLSIAAAGLRYETNSVDFGQAWAPGHTAWVQPWVLALSIQGTNQLIGKQARIHLHAYDYVPGLKRAFVVTANDRLPQGFSPWLLPEGPAARFSPQSVFSFSATAALLADGKVRISLNSLLRRPVNDWIKDRAFSLLLADVWISVAE